jgi:hypothetical protein
MFSSTTYVIRGATPADERDLERIAALDSQRPLTGDIMIGEMDGRPEAALSLTDGRVIADPFRPTANLAAHLRIRARGIEAARETPAVRDRVRRAVHITRLERV